MAKIEKDSTTQSSTASKSLPKGEEIELREEKAPRRIGEIPGWLSRLNLTVTLLFILLLLLAVTLIPYPYSGGESILRHLLP